MKDSDIISTLETMLPQFSGAYCTIGTYILQNRNEVPGLTVKELAERCGVSTATIVRFTHDIGCEGYRDFKLMLSAANARNEHKGTAIANITETDSLEEVVDKLTSFTIKSIEKSAETLDVAALEQTIDLIEGVRLSGGRIYLAGLGSSSVVARSLSIKLMRLNIPALFYEDAHLQLEAVLNTRKGDLLICFTALGRSTENIELINIALERGAGVIMVTQHNSSELNRRVTCVLETSSVETNLRLASQTGLIVQMFITDLLFTSLAIRRLPEIRSGVEEFNATARELGHYVS